MDYRSRRWAPLAATGVLTIALLAACGGGPPAGLDGHLTNDWGGFGQPAAFVPAAEVCHPQPYQQAAPLSEYQPVGCDQPHLVETVHVGQFEGKAARRDTPPPPDSSARRTAYRQCEQRTAEYLGADFRHGRLWLGVATPSEPGWSGGARWFRCDLMEVASVYGEPVERQAPLAGALEGDSEVQLGCYTVSVKDGSVQEMNPVGCGQTHEAEFVGVWRAQDGGYPDPSDGDAESRVYEGCRERVAGYVDVPADGDLIYRTGTIADWMSQQDWAGGDRAFRCYLWLPDQELTDSLQGAGTDALPVRTE